MRELIANVHAGGQWWGPAYGNADQVPAEVAEQITADVWIDVEERPTEQAPDVPSLEDWLAASTGEEVLAFVNDWVSAEDRDRVLLEFVAAEREGEDRQGVVDALVAALPPEPMTPEEIAEAERRAAAQEAAGDSDSTPPQTTEQEEAAAYTEWVHGTSIDGIEEELVKFEDLAERASLAARILEIDADTANGGKARKGLVDRLGQYSAPAGD